MAVSSFSPSPEVPVIGGSAGREFVALFLFDEHGRFFEANIDDLGTRAELDQQHAPAVFTSSGSQSLVR